MDANIKNGDVFELNEAGHRYANSETARFAQLTNSPIIVKIIATSPDPEIISCACRVFTSYSDLAQDDYLRDNAGVQHFRTEHFDLGIFSHGT